MLMIVRIPSHSASDLVPQHQLQFILYMCPILADATFSILVISQCEPAQLCEAWGVKVNGTLL